MRADAKTRRVFPTYVGSIVLGLHLLLSVALLLGGVFDGYANWVCLDEFTLRPMHNFRLCHAQGFLTTFTSVGLSVRVMMPCVNVVLPFLLDSVLAGDSVVMRVIEVVEHVCAWSLLAALMMQSEVKEITAHAAIGFGHCFLGGLSSKDDMLFVSILVATVKACPA